LLEPQLVSRGLSLVSWTRRGYDTLARDPRRVATRLVERLTAGDILLLHDGASARAASGRSVVLEALPRVLDTLAHRGLKAVPLPS
jgi:peptidoglycan/xylan/chitin deacetylase (PgdA/CDA1 family)